jgi:hypothetical protein
LKQAFLVLDLTGFFGTGASEGAHVPCASSNTTFTWTRDQSQLDRVDITVAHDASPSSTIKQLQLNAERQQYSMAFVMESEVHSSTGDAWKEYNFKMTYNLDDSYPEPATYFDMHSYLPDLLTPPSVPFENKETHADIVWIISNCYVSKTRFHRS